MQPNTLSPRPVPHWNFISRSLHWCGLRSLLHWRLEDYAGKLDHTNNNAWDRRRRHLCDLQRHRPDSTEFASVEATSPRNETCWSYDHYHIVDERLCLPRGDVIKHPRPAKLLDHGLYVHSLPLLGSDDTFRSCCLLGHDAG